MRRPAAALLLLRGYPSAALGSLIILLLFAMAGYAVATIPYDEAIRLWRGGEDIWIETPRNARPEWIGLFTGEDIPRTVVATGSARSGTLANDSSPSTTPMRIEFDWPHEDFPSEINLFLDPAFTAKAPYVSMTWRKPDGTSIPIGDRSPGGRERISLSLDRDLTRRFKGEPVEEVLFMAESREKRSAGRGKYVLEIESLHFEHGSRIDARLIVYGKAHGIAGTDHRRRDLSVALLWGAPVALVVGFAAAMLTNIASLLIAAIGAWYGRWIDAIIQRLTEINSILPTLPLLIMIGLLYSRDIATTLGAIVALNIFGLGIKNYRAMFLQIRTSPYIDAARAYGASDMRIVVRYLIPPVIPVLVPHFVIAIPSFVFLEASLAVLGLGDPVLPTWGKIVNDAYANGALYKGYYYWVIGPSILLLLIGVGFSLIGFALDRIFNPKLRSM